MTQEEFNKLVDKYLAGNASPLEERIINDFFSAQESKANLPQSELSDEMWDAVENQIRNTADVKAFTFGSTRKKAKEKNGYSFRSWFRSYSVCQPGTCLPSAGFRRLMLNCSRPRHPGVKS